jgi:hypothetical protein
MLQSESVARRADRLRRLADACDRLDPREERALAEEGLAADASGQPPY